MTIKQLAEKILRETKSEMSCLEIAKQAIRKEYSEVQDPESLAKKISSAISTDIRKHKNKSFFRKVSNGKNGFKKGVYKLKREKASDQKRVISTIKKSDSSLIPKASTLYKGKGGEYAVMSELLFRGYNSNIMSVDEGIDLIASKGTKFFLVQVKTTHYSDGKIIPPSIKKDRFEKFGKHDTFYIITVRYYSAKASRNDFLIFKHTDLERLINTKFIDTDKSNLTLNITIENDTFFIQKNGRKENINYYFNNFDLIK